MELLSKCLNEKVAIITGCNRGIGKAILNMFVACGAKIYAIAREADSLSEYQNKNVVIPCYLDIRDKEAVKELFLRIKRESGKVDILVNNAGVMHDALLGMITMEQMQKTFEVNVFGSLIMMQYASKLMTRQKQGSIINMASILGISGNKGQITYSASKGAVIAMTKAAAKELAPYNIRVNAIAPGIVATDMLQSANLEQLNVLKSKVAMGSIGTPEDVAKATLFLASDLSSYISGQILGVDGMMTN